MVDKETFFAYVRKAPFGGRLTTQQVEGVNSILAAFDTLTDTLTRDSRHLAYILATAFHETGGKMASVREGFAKTDAAARKIVASRAYGKPDPQTKQVYYGRGFVQLTWADNYKRMGNFLGLDLYQEPDLALEPETAALILVEGMLSGASKAGDFTGKSLESFFNDKTDDPVNARRIVNGLDKAKLIASYYEHFLAAIKAAEAEEKPADVKAKDAKPDTPALATDKTVLGGLTSVLGAASTGFLASVNNPWALAAVALVGVGVVLFLTGRLQIRRESGA